MYYAHLLFTNIVGAGTNQNISSLGMYGSHINTLQMLSVPPRMSPFLTKRGSTSGPHDSTRHTVGTKRQQGHLGHSSLRESV